MPSVQSKKFVETFQRVFKTDGRISKPELDALETAHNALPNEAEKAAAKSILQAVRGDKELDAFDVLPVRRALASLMGVAQNRLPDELNRALANAVPQANVKVKKYDLTFDLTGSDATFAAKAVLDLERAAPNETILEVNPERLKIKSVLSDGRAVPYQVNNGRLHVTAPGAKRLEIDYSVKSVSPSPEAYGLIRDKHAGRMWTMTWPYNTGALFPSNSAPVDGSTARVSLKVSNGMTPLGTGTRVNDTTFETNAPSPAYSFAFYAARDFRLGDGGTSEGGVEVDGFGAGNRVPQRNREAYLKSTRESLDFFSQWLGPYDYGNQLNLVEVTGGLGGMEHTGAVAIMLSTARDENYAKETAVHETAHHWFGDNIRIESWGDFWMSEGFTNYATYRFFRHAEGEKKYFSLLDRAKNDLQADLAENPHALTAPPNTDVTEIFDSVPYEMGPWMLRMLETKVGTQKFDALLKDWFKAKRGTSVSTKEFVEFTKQKTGKDFTAFFKEWNSITSVPTFDGTARISGMKVTVSLGAVKTPPAPTMTIPLVITGTDGQTKTVQIKPGTNTLDIDAGFTVRDAKWDPERTVLAFVK